MPFHQVKTNARAMLKTKTTTASRSKSIASLSLVFRVYEGAPRMVQNSLYPNPAFDVAVEHLANQVDAILTHDVRDAQVMVHDLVDGVKRVLLVHNGVKQDAEGPDILLLATVRRSAEDFGCCVVCQFRQHMCS